jgi:formylglycine-generating enzyme required for sulfatase activity
MLSGTPQVDAARFVARFPRNRTRRRRDAHPQPPAAARAQRTTGEAARPRTIPPDAFKECESCPEMIAVPEGSFVMDSPRRASRDRRGPQRRSFRAVAAGRSAVTFESGNACVAEGGCNAYRPGDYGWGGGKRPVINVSWSPASLCEMAVQ